MNSGCLSILLAQAPIAQGQGETEAQEATKIAEVAEGIPPEQRFAAAQLVENGDLVVQVDALAMGRHPLEEHGPGGMADHPAGKEMAIQTQRAQQRGKKPCLEIFVRQRKGFPFSVRTGRRGLAGGKLRNFFEHLHGHHILFPERRSLQDMTYGQVDAVGHPVEIGVIVGGEMSPEHFPYLPERAAQERDGKMVDDVAAHEQVDGQGGFLGLEILLPAGDAVQADDGEVIGIGKIDIVAADKKRQRILANLGKREAEEPPGAVDTFVRFFLVFQESGAVAQINVALQRVAAPVKPGAVLPLQELDVFIQHRAADRGFGILGMAEEGQCSENRTCLTRSVIVHKQTVRVPARVLIQEKTAHEAARAAKVAVGQEACGRHVFRPQRLAVIDDRDIDGVVIERVGGNGAAQPGYGCPDRLFTPEGGHADAQMHGLDFPGIAQIPAAEQNAVALGMDAQPEQAGIGVVAQRQLQRGAVRGAQTVGRQNYGMLPGTVDEFRRGHARKVHKK